MLRSSIDSACSCASTTCLSSPHNDDHLRVVLNLQTLLLHIQTSTIRPHKLHLPCYRIKKYPSTDGLSEYTEEMLNASWRIPEQLMPQKTCNFLDIHSPWPWSTLDTTWWQKHCHHHMTEILTQVFHLQGENKCKYPMKIGFKKLNAKEASVKVKIFKLLIMFALVVACSYKCTHTIAMYQSRPAFK